MVDIRNEEAERKQVTVLFADVKGSMDMAEQQDPEEWRAIMQGFFSRLADAVNRFEGTVDKFTGDGIMAVFGAPIAHEDHARRACYAALQMLADTAEYAGELRRGHGLNFSARIGINSGEVVAGAIGGGGGDYTAIGHTVGLAQRMEAIAEPGKAYLTEASAELAHGYFDLDDLGEFEVKGASRPIRVFELAGVGSARSRLDLSRERGFSRFVGRDEEMRLLEDALERSKGGSGAAVAIVAEPGVGKSRLCHEFAERARAEGLEVFEAQAQAHGREIPYMPVLQMLRAYFGILESDSERIVREKIAGRALLLDPGMAEDLPLLFDFLGVPDPDRPIPQLSPEARQRALRSIVCKLVRAPNRREPIVVLIEDLHWMDEGSGAMLEELLSASEGTKTMVVVNFRPEYEAAWSREDGPIRVELAPLGAGDTDELLRDLVGGDPSLDGLGDLIHARTEGNPFFVEEIVRQLVESGYLVGERGAYRLVRPVEDAGVPATVQAILAARIDRLSPEAKRLLQVASVIGAEAGLRALGRAAGADESEIDPLLCELIDSGFLYEAEMYPERVFAFRHPLTQEVAYGSQLSAQRSSIHAAVGRATIELNPDRHDELAALIANHMEEGGETREAARWSARAAYWAGHSQPRDALRLWQRTSELAGRLDGDEEALGLALASRIRQLDLAWRLGMDRDQEASLEAEAEEIAERTGDIRSLALLHLLRTGRPGVERQIGPWIAGYEEASRLAEESGDEDLRVAIRAAGAYAYQCAGDFHRLQEVAEEIVEMTSEDRTRGAGIVVGSPLAWAMLCKAVAAREFGRLDEAERLLEAAERIAAEQGDPETLSWIRGNLASIQAERGAVEVGLAMARRNCEATERLGDVFSRTLALVNLCTAQLAAEDFQGAFESIDEAQRTYREAMGGEGEVWPWRAVLRAEALTGLGRPEEAAELAANAARGARDNGIRWPLPRALHALGRALRAAGRDGVDEAFEEAAAAAAEIGAVLTLAAIEEDRGSLAAEAGRA